MPFFRPPNEVVKLLGMAKFLRGANLFVASVLTLAFGSAVGCDSESNRDPSKLEEAQVTGRVFAANDGKALSAAQVTVGKSRGKSASDGRFKLSYNAGASTKSVVHVEHVKHAPVSKEAPKQYGYLEVFTKAFDASVEIDLKRGGEARTKQGSGVKIAPGAFKEASGSKAVLSVAAPDVTKSRDLKTLPGDFKAKRGDTLGKLSSTAPVYIEARSKSGEKLALAQGEKASLFLATKSKQKSTSVGLYHFDEEQNTWLYVDDVQEGQAVDGNTLAEAEIDAFGWYALGTFISELSCVRACSVDADENPVPFTRALATGVDLFLEASAFADEDGCFVLEFPASSRFSLSVQSESYVSTATTIESGTEGNLSDPSSCTQLSPIALTKQAQASSPCAHTDLLCGASCVDPTSDAAHCGACDKACGEGAVCVSARCSGGSTDPEVPMDAGTESPDASAPDAGTEEDASEPSVATCVSDPGCDYPTGGCFVRVPGDVSYGTDDFCISMFEMKRDSSGAPESVPAGTPLVASSASGAEQTCLELGDLGLPSNAQWQTLARHIEAVGGNWTTGVVGSGNLVRGHVDGAPARALSVSNADDPCDQSLAPDCTESANSLIQRRTHYLASGSVIWDVGGNLNEWIQQESLPSGTWAYRYAIQTAKITPPNELSMAVSPSHTLLEGTTDITTSSALIEAGGIAILEGQNTSALTSYWVRRGGMIFVRGSNVSSKIYLEPGALYMNIGSNILAPDATVTHSKETLVSGYVGATPVVADLNLAECGGTCPAEVVRITSEGSRGFGYTAVSSNITSRGGSFGMGPLGGVYTALTGGNFFGIGGAAVRCVRPTQPLNP